VELIYFSPSFSPASLEIVLYEAPCPFPKYTTSLSFPSLFFFVFSFDLSLKFAGRNAAVPPLSTHQLRYQFSPLPFFSPHPTRSRGCFGSPTSVDLQLYMILEVRFSFLPSSCRIFQGGAQRFFILLIRQHLIPSCLFPGPPPFKKTVASVAGGQGWSSAIPFFVQKSLVSKASQTPPCTQLSWKSGLDCW